MKALNICSGIVLSGILSLILFSCTETASDNVVVGPATKPKNTDPNKGKTIFYSRCASCHKINEDMTGPALGGAETSWISKKTLYAFVRNSQEVIQYDSYARSLWLKYNQTVMTPQPDLTDDDIQSIFDYIETQAIR